MTIPKAGDRIRLTSHMADDPDPVPIGTEGTVTLASEVTGLGPPYVQVGVKWDNGRSLGLVCPPDSFSMMSGGSRPH